MAVRAVESEFPGLLQDPSSGFSGTWGSFSPTHAANAKKAEYNGLLAGLSLSQLGPWGDMPRGEVAQVLGNLLSLLSGSGKQVPDGWTVTQLTDNTYDEGSPEIHNGQVVWWGDPFNSDGTFDYQEIFLYDTSTGATTQLTDNTYRDRHPQIYNGQVVWSGDQPNSDGTLLLDSQIFLYDTSTGATTQLTDNTYDDGWLEIHNGQVVWCGYQPNGDGTNDWEIFLATK